MSKDSNTIFIGRKPTMSYVLAVITSFNSTDTEAVTLKARGQAITTAVDVAEIVKRKFMKDLNVDEITTGTEEIKLEEGGSRNVSTIEIKLARKLKPSEKKEKAKNVEPTEDKSTSPKTTRKTKKK